MMVAGENGSRQIFVELGGRLDREGGPPLYQQIANLLRSAIRTHAIAAGAPVPPQRELSVLWGIGEVTVRRAMRELAAQGLLDARAGGGTVVRNAAMPPVANGSTEPATPSRPLTLGIAFADLADGYPFMQPLLEGLRDTSRPVAVRMFDMPADDLPHGSLDHAPSLAGLDGLAMMSPVNLRLLTLCQERSLPCVLLFSDIADGYSRCIVVDYARGIHQAVRHLQSHGCQRVALVTAGRERFSTGQLVDAYRDALDFAGLPHDPAWLVHAGYLEADGYRAARQLLAMSGRPDAILFASDFQARGGLIAAHEQGLPVPDALRVIGAGRLLPSEGWPTALTTIDLRMVEAGRLARTTIEAMLTGEGEQPYRQSVASELVPGDTG